MKPSHLVQVLSFVMFTFQRGADPLLTVVDQRIKRAILAAERPSSRALMTALYCNKKDSLGYLIKK